MALENLRQNDVPGPVSLAALRLELRSAFKIAFKGASDSAYLSLSGVFSPSRELRSPTSVNCLQFVSITSDNCVNSDEVEAGRTYDSCGFFIAESMLFCLAPFFGSEGWGFECSSREFSLGQAEKILCQSIFIPTCKTPSAFPSRQGSGGGGW
jgi:hypothetical protein